MQRSSSHFIASCSLQIGPSLAGELVVCQNVVVVDKDDMIERCRRNSWRSITLFLLAQKQTISLESERNFTFSAADCIQFDRINSRIAFPQVVLISRANTAEAAAKSLCRPTNRSIDCNLLLLVWRDKMKLKRILY